MLVAGGGIAGSAAALLLGRTGLTVELFERGTMPREKPCGEGLMPGGVAALERWGMAEAVGGEPFQGVRYRLGNLVAEGRFPAAAGHPATGRGQRRWHLDRVLLEAAAATPGVAAHLGIGVDGPLVEEGRVVGLAAGGRAHRARLVVAADGLRSPLRRQLGLEGPRPSRTRVGVRTHYRLAPDQPHVPWVEVYVGGGYELYVTPLPDRELLVAGLAEAGQIMGGAASAFATWLVGQPHLAARLAGAERLTPFQGRAPLEAAVRRGYTPGCVLLGDAAGYVDPITGGGMTQAMLCAELLAAYAPALVRGEDVAFARFDQARRALLRDYWLMTRAVLALARRRALAGAVLRGLDAAPWLFSHLLGVAGGTRRLLPSVGA